VSFKKQGRLYFVIEKKSIQDKHIGISVHKGHVRLMKDIEIKRNPAVFLAFIVTGILLILLFAILGFYPFGANSVIISDLSAQYAPNLVAYKNQFLYDGVHTYSFLIGMGKNVFGIFAYYLSSPVNFVTFLFPDTMISEAVLVIITLKLSLAAATMTLFLRKRFHSTSKFSVLFGIVYATCSYAMVYMINIMWLDGFLLLPLLLFFVEQYLENNKYWWRVELTLFVLFVSGFYIAYIVGIFSFLYVLVRLMEEKKTDNVSFIEAEDAVETETPVQAKAKESVGSGIGEIPKAEPGSASIKNTWKTVGIFIGSALIAAGMSAAILLPAGMDILGNPDQSARNISLNSNFSFLSFLNQFLPGSFDDLSYNKPLVYCGLAVLFLCILYFLNPCFSRRQKGLMGGSLLFMVMSFNLSFLDFAWQLFDTPNWFKYRYSFLLVFVMLIIAFASLLHIRSLKPKSFIVTGLLFLALLLVVQGFGDLNNEGERFYINLFMGALELLCLYAMTGVKFPANVANLKKLIPALLVLLICIEVVYVNPLYMRPKMFGGESKREPLVTAITQGEDLVTAAKEDANKDAVSFYRCEADGTLLDEMSPMSAGLYLNYRGISNFTSSSNKELNRFLKQLGYNTNYNYFTTTHSYSSVVTDSLLGIRYILSGKENPGGYQLLDTSPNGKLYLQKNNQVLPLMYLVNADAADFDFFALEKNPEDKNYFAFQDELLVSLFGNTSFPDPVYYEAEVQAPVVYNAIVKEKEPEPLVDADISSDDLSSALNLKTSIADTDLLGEEPVDKELDYGTSYLRMSHNDLLSLTYSVNVTSTDPLFLSIPAVATNSQADVYVNGTYFEELSSSMYSQILSLGSFTPGETVAVKVRSDSNSYSILSALFYYCDTALFEKEITAAVQNQDVRITQARDGYVAAQISVPQDQLLLTTIPYEKGWTLRVDGVVTPIEAYQAALISVPVTAGSHTITLSFTPPGMWAGIAVSSAVGLVFLGAIIYTYRKRSKPL